MKQIEMSPELSQFLSDKSQELLLIFEDNGDIVYCNRLALMELCDGEFPVNRCITEIFPLVIFNRNSLVYWSSMEEYLYTFAYRKNQTCFPVKLWIHSMHQGDRRMNVCFAIDDTERNDAVRNHQRAMDKVANAISMKNEFTANITHELRTPINGIKGMAESLRDLNLTQEQEELVTIILKCCDNMTKIINDILDFSKMEAGKFSIERREFSFKGFLDEILVMNASRINEKGLKLVIDVGKNIPSRLIGDELRLGQVLNNFFSNAIKFTSVGHIGLEVTNTFEDDTTVELLFMVVDTGIGIAPEDKDKLFKSFSQVDGSITRRFGGTGLGLAICRQLVELMGGKVSVDSEKGRGSAFSFTVRFGKGSSDVGRLGYPEGKFTYEKTHSSLPAYASSYERQEPVKMQYMQVIPMDGMSRAGIEEDEKYRMVAECLEKLLICVELEAWDKAEGFAGDVRNYLRDENAELKNTSFALLLNVRKGNHDKSMELIGKLQETFGDAG